MTPATLSHLSLRWALLGALLWMSVAAAAAEPSADREITVQVGDQKRTCIVHLPRGYEPGQSLPLLIAFHGSGGTGRGFIGSFSVLADRHRFIAACPDGITGRNRGWNALFGKPIPGGQGAQVDDVDDVAFVRLLIDQLHETYHTDASKVFVCGHSSGAYMAYRVAIDLSDRVAAAGVVNGLMGIRLLDGKPSVDEIRRPVAPVSILHICGKKDGLVKFEGGKTQRVLAWSVPQCVEHFVKANGCDPAGIQTRDAEHSVARTLYSKGQAQTEVELVVVENCDHNWPNLKQHGFAATEALWDFFSRHPKPPPPSPKQ